MKGALRIAVVVIALFTVTTAAGQELDLHVGADSVTVGERFRISVTARHDFAASPRFPEGDTSSSLTFGDVEVVATHAVASFQRYGGRVDSVVYEVTTFALDTARIAPIPVLFAAGEDTFTIATEPTWLPVISLVPEDAQDVRDLAPLVDFPSPSWPYVAAAAILLILAALIAFYLRRRRRGAASSVKPAAAPVPPDREALERLDALEGVDLSVREHVQPFYDELSGLLRTYVARRLYVRAMESTTGELVRELRLRDLPDEETTARLRNVLVASDYVKFADASPPPAEGKQLVRTSRTIIHDVERRLNPPEEEAESHDVSTVQ